MVQSLPIVNESSWNYDPCARSWAVKARRELCAGNFPKSNHPKLHEFPARPNIFNSRRHLPLGPALAASGGVAQALVNIPPDGLEAIFVALGLIYFVLEGLVVQPLFVSLLWSRVAATTSMIDAVEPS